MSLPILNFLDPAVAARIAEESSVISASAGSGKTFTLATLVAGALGRGTRAPEIVATSFTREAAADLRRRLLAPLDQLAAWDEGTWATALEALQAGWPAWDAWWKAHGSGLRGEIPMAARVWVTQTPSPEWLRSARSAREHWVRTRREAELMTVTTVHGLALSVLRAGGQGGDGLLDAKDPTLVRLLRAAGREVLDLPPGDPDAAGARLLWAWCEGRKANGWRWDELAAAFDAHLDAQGAWRADLDTTPVRAALLTKGRALLDVYAEFQKDPMRAGAVTKKGPIHAGFLKSGLAALMPEPGPSASDRQVLEALNRMGRRFKPSDTTGKLSNYYSASFDAAMTPLRSDLPAAFEAWMTLLLERVFRRYAELKGERGLRSYGDLVREALTALKTAPGQSPALLLVDEYQDINPIQEDFLEALGAARTVIVGDPKQAIYGFRGGVPDLLMHQLESARTHGRAFRLAANFRSAAPIVETANAFVADVVPALNPAASDPDGTQAHGGRGEGETRVGLASVVPRKKSGGDLTACAPWIIALAQEAGWRNAGFQPLPGQRTKALLLPARTGLPALRRLLHTAGVEPLVQSKEGFWESPGVRLMVCLLEAVAHPTGTAARVAILRSPWVGATDPELAAWLRDLPETSPSIQAGLQWLEGLLLQTTQAILAAGFTRPGLLEFLAATEVHGATEPARARRNLDHLLGLAAALPPDPALALATLRQMRATKDPGDAPATDTLAPLVIATVHGSKGLEYDDVILPALADRVKGIAKGTIGLWPGQDRHLWMGWSLGPVPGPALADIKAHEYKRAFREGLNLFYVAITRAKGRMALLQQASVSKDGEVSLPPTGQTLVADGKAVYWHNVSEDLRGTSAPVEELPETPPSVPALPARAPAGLAAPETAEPWVAPTASEAPDEAMLLRQEQGIQMHALLREVLVRESHIEGAGVALLDHHPFVKTWPGARDLALWFLDSFKERGLAGFPRRCEFPLPPVEGLPAGRADLVIWEPDRGQPVAIHLLDFKLAPEFSPETLAEHQAQLARYRTALEDLHPGVRVHPWLISLEGNRWV